MLDWTLDEVQAFVDQTEEETLPPEGAKTAAEWAVFWGTNKRKALTLIKALQDGGAMAASTRLGRNVCGRRFHWPVYYFKEAHESQTT